MASTRVGCSRKTREIDGDVDSPARRHDLVAAVQIGTDEELAALSSIESGTNLQGLVDRYSREIANGQLARESRLLQSADHEPRDVVESSGDDSAVSTTGCPFECPPQYEVGDDFFALELNLEFDACRIRVATHGPVFESAPAQGRFVGDGPHQGKTVTSRRLADGECQLICRLRQRGKHSVLGIVRRKRVAKRSQACRCSFPFLFGLHTGKCRERLRSRGPCLESPSVS